VLDHHARSRSLNSGSPENIHTIVEEDLFDTQTSAKVFITADGTRVPATCVGKLPLILTDAEGTQSFFVLENVFAVPAFAYTLLSVSSLVRNGASLDISRSHQQILLPSPGQGASPRAIPLREANDGLYLIDAAIATVSDVRSPDVHVLGAFRDPHTFQHPAALPANKLATAMFCRLPFGAEKLRCLAVTSPDVPSRIAQGTPRLEDTWSIANAKFTAHAGARPPCPPSTGSVTHTETSVARLITSSAAVTASTLLCS